MLSRKSKKFIMQDQVKLFLRDDDYYSDKISSYEMFILVNFLLSEVSLASSSWKNWILDPSQDLTLGNITEVDKEGDHIFLRDLFSEEPEGGPYLKISIKELLNIIDSWDQLLKTKPKEILITRENGTITMEGKD